MTLPSACIPKFHPVDTQRVCKCRAVAPHSCSFATLECYDSRQTDILFYRGMSDLPDSQPKHTNRGYGTVSNETNLESSRGSSPLKRSKTPHGTGGFPAPGGGRTHNLRLRRPTLYPIELPVRRAPGLSSTPFGNASLSMRKIHGLAGAGVVPLCEVRRISSLHSGSAVDPVMTDGFFARTAGQSLHVPVLLLMSPQFPRHLSLPKGGCPIPPHPGCDRPGTTTGPRHLCLPTLQIRFNIPPK